MRGQLIHLSAGFMGKMGNLDSVVKGLALAGGAVVAEASAGEAARERCCTTAFISQPTN